MGRFGWGVVPPGHWTRRVISPPTQLSPTGARIRARRHRQPKNARFVAPASCRLSRGRPALGISRRDAGATLLASAHAVNRAVKAHSWKTPSGAVHGKAVQPAICTVIEEEMSEEENVVSRCQS